MVSVFPHHVRMATELMGGRAAARLLGVNPTTFYDLVRDGVVTSIEVEGGSPVYRRSEILDAARQRAELRRAAAERQIERLEAEVA